MKIYEVYLKGPKPNEIIGTVEAQDGNDAIKKVRASLEDVYYPRDDCAARVKKEPQP